jgi:phosphoglycolate phosphatase-like HAD superfamily hydrolase
VIKLLLFDIDGTLVLTGGAGGRAMGHAAADVFQVEGGLGSISMAGRTDAWIVSQMAARFGVEYDEELLARFHDRYVEHLSREIHHPGPQKGVLPGIRDVLDRLATQKRAELALLTGNFERGARIKLEYFDLWRYFPCGAFGDAAHDRNSLLGVALQRYRACGGPHVESSEVLIIGDTPLDIAVAVAGGARSLGVATGNYGPEELRASGADVVLKDLSDVNAALEGMGVAAGPG